MLQTCLLLYKGLICPAALCITFVFAQWWAFEAATVPRGQTLNEDNTLNLHVTPPLRKASML